MTKSFVKPSLERIENKLDTISHTLCGLSPDCEPEDTENETSGDSED